MLYFRLCYTMFQPKLDHTNWNWWNVAFSRILVLVIERARNSQRMSKNISQRPYHAECTSSRPITEVKQHWALLVLGWETAWEHRVLLAFCFFSISRLCSKKYKFWWIHKVIWWCFIVTREIKEEGDGSGWGTQREGGPWEGTWHLEERSGIS